MTMKKSVIEPPLPRFQACFACRARKIRCDGEKPTCGPCIKSAYARGEEAKPCEYQVVTHPVRRKSRKDKDASPPSSNKSASNRSSPSNLPNLPASAWNELAISSPNAEIWATKWIANRQVNSQTRDGEGIGFRSTSSNEDDRAALRESYLEQKRTYNAFESLRDFVTPRAEAFSNPLHQLAADSDSSSNSHSDYRTCMYQRNRLDMEEENSLAGYLQTLQGSWCPEETQRRHTPQLEQDWSILQRFLEEVNSRQT
ncbi:hypothetical protein BT69DRAFT_1324497 [Atractiella rhizophila]|nr:hypothetical protein BT69DRAFT_1324497 [Atractiella rhizophila]